MGGAGLGGQAAAAARARRPGGGAGRRCADCPPSLSGRRREAGILGESKDPPRRAVVAFADGASRGNPGPAALGIVLYDQAGKELHRAGRALGRATNNQAEYRAAIAALEAALGLDASEVELCMDSELVVRQLFGRYRVRNPRLIPLHKRMLDLRSRFQRVTVRHVPRGQNKVADRLANEALDRASR